MTSTTKIVIAVIIIAVIGIVAYRMGMGPVGPSLPDTSDESVAPATGNINDVVSAFEADFLSEAGLITSGDDSDLLNADGQAIIDLNGSYEENSL